MKTGTLFCKHVFRLNSARYFTSPLIQNESKSIDGVTVEEFRVYEIPGLKPKEQMKAPPPPRRKLLEPRYKKMPTDQDWTNVWPTASTFKHSVVPLPLRQGYCDNLEESEGVSPPKHLNAELMKVPNFFHLTRAHIVKHCAALKRFCTEWPSALYTDRECEQHFPIEVTTSDYVFTSPSIRDPRARTVTMVVKLSRLSLDDHAKDKFIRLVGERYDPKTDIVTFTSDRCPTKKQNYDYIQYLLTACYFESQKIEPWEDGKTEADNLSYVWEMTPSKQSVLSLVSTLKTSEISESDILQEPNVERYREAVTSMANVGENTETVEAYKQSVLKLLNIT